MLRATATVRVRNVTRREGVKEGRAWHCFEVQVLDEDDNKTTLTFWPPHPDAPEAAKWQPPSKGEVLSVVLDVSTRAGRNGNGVFLDLRPVAFATVAASKAA